MQSTRALRNPWSCRCSPGARAASLVIVASLSLLTGCGTRDAPQAAPAAAQPPRSTSTPPTAKKPQTPTASPPPASEPEQASGPRTASTPQSPAFWSADPLANRQPRTPLPKREIDETRAAAAGLRKIAGKRLTLYTDLPPHPEVDNLCDVFDQAYPQWCRYFETPLDEAPEWRMTGYLMKDKERFQQAGLFPDNLPPFPHGYSRDDELWLYDQPSDYYRRHLLLHEGTHGFMYTRLNAAAPPWYIEGIAELLGTHRWAEGKLTLNYFPQHRDEVPQWGRIRIVQDDFKANRAMFLKGVFDMDSRSHMKTDAYGWCWAAAAFLEGHPRYRERFHKAAQFTRRGDFVTQFAAEFSADARDLFEEWQIYVGDLEYGYDLSRAAIEFKPGKPLAAEGAKVTIAADRGWQSSQIHLEVGERYQLKASGRYQVASEPKPWMSEPQGVSIRYYKGWPLGMLLAAVRPDENDPDAPSGLFRVRSVGREDAFAPLQSGTLYLRINDSCAELADNAGTLEVEVKRVPGDGP